MKVLIAGSGSYLASFLIPHLVQNGHEVTCLVRDKKYFLSQNKFYDIKVLQGDLLRKAFIEPFPEDTDVAFYLAGRLIQTTGFAGLEALSAQNFMQALAQTNCRQLLATCELNSLTKQHVDDILDSGNAAFTNLRLSMLIGEDSIALRLFDGLTRNKNIIITSAWANAQIQPVYIDDVLTYIDGCLLNEATFNKRLDICGPEVMSFKQMVYDYLSIFRAGKHHILSLPVLNANLAAYLANFLAPLNYPEAKSLLENLKYDSVSRDNRIWDIIPHVCVNFKQSLIFLHDHTGHTVRA